VTALHRNSKLDTVFFGDALVTDLFTDLSQNRTPLDDLTTYLEEAPSARTALDAPREVAVVFSMSTGDEGVVLEHGNVAIYGYQVRVVGDALICSESGTDLVTVDIPGLTGSDRPLMVHWSQFVDGSDVRSEVVVFNGITSEWAFGFATHAPNATDPTDTFTVGAGIGGSNPFDAGLAAIRQVRIGARFHSLTEAAEDWIAETTPPTVDAAQRCEGTPVTVDTLIGDDESFAGPAAIYAGRATHQAGRRLLSPVVNHLVLGAPLLLRSTYVPTRWTRFAWDTEATRLALTHLFRRPVSPVVREVFVRVHFVQWTTGADVVPVYLRCYSIDKLPTYFNNAAATPTYFHTEEVAINVDHGVSGDGEWVTLGRLPIARDGLGTSTFAIGYDFNHDAADAELANTFVFIRAITIDPFPTDGGGGPSGLDVQEGG
jgi:hypothetical protein